MLARKHYSGGLTILVGLGVLLESTQYDIGTLSRMGPGYYPMLLGYILVFLGLVIALMPSSDSQRNVPGARFSMRSVLQQYGRSWSLIIGGMIAFIALGHYLGFAIAAFSMILISALADRKNSFKSCALLAICTTAAAVLVFHYGLHIQFPLFTFPGH